MSGEASVEVSVPTDLTVTSDGESEVGYAASRRHARELQALAADRAELQRTVEKQKLELQSRDAQIAALNAQHEVAVANAIAQKDNEISSRQIQVNRLEAELLRTKEELNTIHERAARELAQLTQKCAVFQQNQKRLMLRQDEIKSSLSNLQLSEEEFVRLRSTPVQQLTLKQYTSLRVYELVWPLRLKVKELESVQSSLESMVNNKNLDLKSKTEHCQKLQKDIEELQRKSEHYASQLMGLRDEQRTDDFKVRNFNRIKAERDQFEEEKNSSAKKVCELELMVATLKKERNILEERYSEYKAKARKQESELDHCQNDLSDTKSKLDKVNEELRSVSKSLRQERERCEELHEKYVSSRGEVTSLTENNQDLHHELKLLREKHHACIVECTNLQSKVDFLTAKNEELTNDVDKFKTKYDTEVKALELQLKEFKESNMILSKSHDSLLSENSKFRQEIQALELALHKEKLLRERETVSLKEELKKFKQSLKEYQALEDEYAKNIRTAAALPEDQASTSIGRILPGHALAGNKAVEQSVQLTRRILLLERQNTEAATTIQKLTDVLEQLKGKVASYKSALGLAGQPYATVLERVASLDDQVTTLQEALNFNSVSKKTLEEENKSLMRDVANLQRALENQTLQNNELRAIKQHLINIKQTVSQFTPQQTPEMDGEASDTPFRAEDPQKSPAKAIIITRNLHGRRLQ
ncbi:progesterone-induced-blocking factor 1-like [Macrobrachium rosenbergii]|uniref:progesterone-induced-blocking factor 1-like n=1 Tax=Macrobrachium rosenbergii TaxID=79674 RepID=UPI0034D3D153